jgi:protein O-GlcNAc transferase
MRLVDACSYIDAEAAARRILGGRPTHSLALKALGFALIGQGRYDDALPILRFSLTQVPDDPELHNNLGIVLSALMHWDEALQCFRRSLDIKPEDPEVLNNHGAALARMYRYDEAIPLFLKAIECHPGDYLKAIEQLGSALLYLKQNDGAWACFNELWKNDPVDATVLSQLLCVNLRRCDWADLDERLLTLRSLSTDERSLADNPFVALSFPGVTSAEQRRIAASFARHNIPTSVLEAPDVVWPTPEVLQGENGRLRIAYLSADFRDHAVGRIVPRVIELHDRSRVEVFGYSIGIDDKSYVRQRLVTGFDHFVDLLECSVLETALRIRADRIDILIDLNGWTAGGRPEALALRCAPIQVNWLGYAGTLGHPRLADYLLGDAVATPAKEQVHYTETLAHLPNCYLPADTAGELSAPPSRADAGLPAKGFVFCSFNNSYKFNPRVFDIWCRLLRELPDSCLWLSQPGGSAQERLQREVQARDVEPARLIFAPRLETTLEHLSRLQLADLALDPFPYNSHSSGIDVLWAGVPMVTLLGDTFPSRVGASLLRAAGLEELIAPSPDAYFQLALVLARDTPRLRALRGRLLENKRGCPLFDMPRFVRSLEDVYFRMWDGHLQGGRTALV